MDKHRPSNDFNEKTKQSEERLLALMKATTDVIYRMSPDWKTMTELYGRGFLADTVEPDPDWLGKYIPPENQAVVLDVINDRIKEKKIFELEHRVLRVDGSIGWTHSRAMPLLNENGEIKEWICAAKDITTRKLLEEETLELIDGFTEGSWVVDRIKGTIRCSEKWSKRIGLDRVPEKERLSYTHTLTHPDDTKNGNSIEHCMEAGMPRFDLEYRVKTTDGGYIWTQNKGKIVYDMQGKAIKVYAATIDITERKKLEYSLRNRTEELEGKEKEYLEIIDSSSEGSFIHDIVKKEIHFSSEWKNKLGIPHLSPVQAAKVFMSLAHPDDVEGMQKAYDEACKHRSPKVRMEFRAKTDTGYIWILGQAKIIYDEEGNPVKYYGTHMDITDRKNMENALRESEERFRVAQELSPDGFTILSPVRDADGQIIDFTWLYENEAIAKLNGTNPKAVVGQRLLELFPVHRGTPFLEAYLHVAKTGESLILEAEYGHESMLKPTWFRIVVVRMNGDIAILAQDITEQKRADKMLRESEERYAYLLKLSDILRPLSEVKSIWDAVTSLLAGYLGASDSSYNEITEDTIVIKSEELNDTEQRLFGTYMINSYPASSAIMSAGRNLVIPDVLSFPEFSEEERARALALNFRAIISVPFIKGGKLIGTLAVRQITPRNWTLEEVELVRETADRTWLAIERVKAEEALLEKTRQLDDANRQKEDILESISDCFYVLDKDLRFTYVNKPAEEIWGISRTDLLGRKIEEVFPGIIDISMSKFHQVLQERSPQHYEVYSKVIGRWGDMGVYPMRDGISVYFRDTTKRKKMEETLTFQAHTLASLQEAICAVDENFNITFWNEMAEKMFGWTAQEAIGNPSKEIFKMISPSNREESIDNILKNNGYTGEAIYMNKDGKEVYTSVICSVIRDAQRNYKGNVSSFRDITERKKMEEALRESEGKALALVKELEKADINKNQFISALSHELRNPLAVISAGLEILGISQDKGQMEKAKDIMSRQMNQLCALVDELLDLTRISNNKIELKKEQIEINRIALSIAEDQRMLFEEKKIELYTRTSADSMYLDADPVRIKQVIGNLLHNALKYTQTGGETLISVYKENKEAVISVKDNGIGLSPEIIPRLFQPFVQADISLDRSGGGLGLGLSITKGIIELHGGTVSAYSEGLGRGSEFIIRLPLSEMNDRNEAGKVKKTDTLNRSLKI